MNISTRLCRTLIIVLCCAPAPSIASSKKVNAGGVTYEIAEKDALEEIRERAESANVREFINKKNRNEWSVWRGHPLPESTDNKERFYVPWYVLERDIPGPRGEVLYPKGYTFNPLSYIKLPQRIVVFKLDQYKRIKKYLKPSDILIADSGDVVEASSKFGVHINILSDQIVRRFGLERVPSFIDQDGTRLRIREVNIHGE